MASMAEAKEGPKPTRTPVPIMPVSIRAMAICTPSSRSIIRTPMPIKPIIVGSIYFTFWLEGISRAAASRKACRLKMSRPNGAENLPIHQ